MEQGPWRGEMPAAEDQLVCAGNFSDLITESYEFDFFRLGD